MHELRHIAILSLGIKENLKTIKCIYLSTRPRAASALALHHSVIKVVSGLWLNQMFQTLKVLKALLYAPTICMYVYSMNKIYEH